MAGYSTKQKQVLLGKMKEFISRYGKHLASKGFDLGVIANDYIKSLDEGVPINNLNAQLMYITGALDDFGVEKCWGYHHKLMQEMFDLEHKRIASVGAGVVPVLEMEIAKSHPTSIVDAYDPDIITDIWALDNLNPIAEEIIWNKKDPSKNTDLSSYGFIFGVRPCKGMIPTIELASELGLDYYLSACACKHNVKPSKPYEEQAKYYINYATRKAPRDRQIEVIWPEDPKAIQTPTIISRRRIR